MSEMEILTREIKEIREDISEFRNMLELIGAKLYHALPLLENAELRQSAELEEARIQALLDRPRE